MIECNFCTMPAERVWMSSALVVAFRDSYPISEGHTLVIPTEHYVSIYEAPQEVLDALWMMVAKVRQALAAELSPDGFNIGVNDGLAAGQTMMHGHIHVIPRYSGDVVDPRGGIRWVIPSKAAYWKDQES